MSVTSKEGQADRSSQDVAVSSNGRFVAFSSSARNLVPDDTNWRRDTFVRDRQTGSTERVSVSSLGGQADLGSGSPAISADGRFVAFSSFASNLVPGDTNNSNDVFVRDRQTGITERISVSSAGLQADDRSDYAAISGDGRFVAFTSRATNLVGRDTNDSNDVFVRDRLSGRTERISAMRGRQADDVSYLPPAISADGRFVAFVSSATNLVPRDTNGADDIFLHDRRTNMIERVSVSNAGDQANHGSREVTLDASGRFVAFTSFANNLVGDDTNGDNDVFVRDVVAESTERVSVSTAGNEGNSGSNASSLSSDGRRVAFHSFASNLVPGDGNGRHDIFVRDVVAGSTERVSVSTAGGEADHASVAPAFGGDGLLVGFHSFATNLVDGDTNGSSDVFVHELGP